MWVTGNTGEVMAKMWSRTALMLHWFAWDCSYLNCRQHPGGAGGPSNSRDALVDELFLVQSVARQIEARISHRRAIKMAIAATMRLGAEGIKINIAGRVNGAEIARSESYKEGRIPLHTFRADIDYALMEAHTTYGRIGIKCWICLGLWGFN